MARGRNPEVGTTAQLGVISVRINASAESAPEAAALLDQVEGAIHGRLGTLVFGREDETLASAVGRLLAERNETVATAESCTGGLIGTLLTDTPGSSRYYAGGVVTYSNALKHSLLGVGEELISQHGAVSEAAALAMACGARERLATTYALAVTGVAGPEGGTPAKPVGLVYVALASPQAARAHELRFGPQSPRDVVRMRAAHAALNLLRLELMDCR
jgi:nicotinamide-nucleotide amidase